MTPNDILVKHRLLFVLFLSARNVPEIGHKHLKHLEGGQPKYVNDSNSL